MALSLYQVIFASSMSAPHERTARALWAMGPMVQTKTKVLYEAFLVGTRLVCTIESNIKLLNHIPLYIEVHIIFRVASPISTIPITSQ